MSATTVTFPLGVACNHCLHRALLWPDTIGKQAGRPPEQLRLHCSKCGQRDYETLAFAAEREARKFMAEYR
jgi:DNA-directed RNA polymerase subunit RPC12/RpoP